MNRTLSPKRCLKIGLAGSLALSLIIALGITACTTLGKSPDAKRLALMERSPHWQDGRFTNPRERVQGSLFQIVKEALFNSSDYKTPVHPFPVIQRQRVEFNNPPELRVTWLGHSTLIVEIEGKRFLVDPVWSERVSPVSFAGPKRWYAPPLPLEELPDIDAVLISHDHYDHLDYPTVLKLAERGVQWIVPLGIGAHLEYWGVPSSKITELDWWQDTELSGIQVTATPARHFSGRTLWDQQRTLWCGFALSGSKHRVYYSGDTALFDELVKIGDRLGPFDLTMIEAGAYGRLWADVHLGPEQAVRAHQLVRGDIFLPVHWGLFTLALHGWTEPIERVLAAAKTRGVRVAVLRPGESIIPPQVPLLNRWWPQDVPWSTDKDDPIQSTGVEYLMQ